MAIKLGGKSIKSMYLGGKSVKEAWLNGEKVWPDFNSPILGYEPTIFMPLNGDALDYSGNNHNPIGMVGTLESYTAGFNHSKCWDLVSGGAALKLDPITKGKDFTISVCVFSMGKNNTTRDGVLGGVIGGNHSLGLGYAIGQGSNVPLSDDPLSFQFYNGGGNQFCSGTKGTFIQNGWNHYLVRFSGTNRTVEFYLNGVLNGLVTPSEYPHAGPISYSDRDRGWDGNIWLGRCFQTITQPYDWWNGYIQDFAYWDYTISDILRDQLFLTYMGNMLPSTTKSPYIADLMKKSSYVCTGGTGTTNDSVKPNMVPAQPKTTSTTGTLLEISKSGANGLPRGIYLSRSYSVDIVNCSSMVEGIYNRDKYRIELLVANVPVPLTNMLSTLAFNVDGSGTFIPFTNAIIPSIKGILRIKLPLLDTMSVEEYNISMTS